MTRDPVCGRLFEENKAAAMVEYQRQLFYFCSRSCHKAFAAEPRRYAANPTRAASLRVKRAGAPPRRGQ